MCTQLQYIYHKATASILTEIQANGVQPSDSSSRDHHEKNLQRFADEEELTLPITRQNCVFFHPTLDQAVETIPIDDPVVLKFQRRQVIAIIDLHQVQTVPYVGDFQIFSDIIDLSHMDHPDDAVVSTSYEDALRTYIETLQPLSIFDSPDEIDEQYHLPEVLIEDGVTAAAVVDALFHEQIQQY